MDNLPSYPSYPDSGVSSAFSREIDSENQSWDEPSPENATYKVKLMCSYGGKIQPRPHDNQLAYVGGDTKILSVDRNIKFAAVMAKLSALYGGDGDFCFKYQLPGEDLDALISVTNDEDLDHMMLEYDRLYRASAKPARLRLFLFPFVNPLVAAGLSGVEMKSEGQWFVDALNLVPVQNLEGSSPPAAVAASATNPDFLFGLDKVKSPDSASPQAPVVLEVVTKDVTAGSDSGCEESLPIGESAVPPAPLEIQAQIQELQRLQIAANHEQNLMHIQNDEPNIRSPPHNIPDYHKTPEKFVPAPAPAHVPVQMQIPTAYYPERHITTSGYPVAAAAAGTDQHQPIYLIPASAAGVYQRQPTLRQPTGSAGQPYYGVQRVVQEVYQDQPYNPPVQQPKMGAYTEGMGISMVQPKSSIPEPTYVQVGYDGAGRQVYYTTTQYQGGATALNQEGKVVVNGMAPQPSAV